MKRKLAYYNIVITKEYYINNVNVLDESNTQYIKDIKIKVDELNDKFNVENAKLYYIDKLNLKIVITNISRYKLMGLLSWNDYFKLRNHFEFFSSEERNHKNMVELVKTYIDKVYYENIMYSDDYMVRAVINTTSNKYSVYYQDLMPEYAYQVFLNDVIDINELYEDSGSISYYDNLEDLNKDVQAYFDRYNEYKKTKDDDSQILWHYSSGRLITWLYKMLFVFLGTIILPCLLMIFPIMGLSEWNIVYFFGGIILFSMTLSGIIMWLSKDCFSYSITNKCIFTNKGIGYTLFYENIKDIKVKKFVFNKKYGTIKFKLHKGSAINYNISLVKNYEEAYSIIKSFIDEKRNTYE